MNSKIQLHRYTQSRPLHDVWNNGWSNVMAKHATHGSTQGAKQSVIYKL